MKNLTSSINMLSYQPVPTAAIQPPITRPIQRCASTSALPNNYRWSAGPPARQHKINGTPSHTRSNSSESCGNLTDITEIIGEEDFYIPDPVPEAVDMATLKIGDQFGCGVNASVHDAKVLRKDKWIDCVVKRPLVFSEKPAVEESTEDEKDMARFDLKYEFDIQNSLNHYNLMPCYGHSDNEAAIAMPRAQATLKTVLKQIKLLPDARRIAVQKTIMQQMIKGLLHIYRKRIAHPDLHLGNYLYMQGRVCVADFGLASVVPQGEYSITNAKNQELPFSLNPFEELAHLIYFRDENDGNNIIVISEKNLSLVEILIYLTNEEIDCAMRDKVFSIKNQRDFRDTLIQLNDNFQQLEGCLSTEALAAELNSVLDVPL